MGWLWPSDDDDDDDAHYAVALLLLKFGTMLVIVLIDPYHGTGAGHTPYNPSVAINE